jgi:hypothetical protein
MNIERIDPSHKVLWPGFKNFCKNNSLCDVDTDHWDDVKTNWDTYLAGATMMYLLIKKGEVEL